MSDLTGKVALITGAASGIGAATAAQLAAAGMRLVLVDRDADAVRALASRVGGVAHVGDVTDPACSEGAVRLAVERYQRLDLVHANAGRMTTRGFAPTDMATLDIDNYLATVDVNVHAVVYAVRAALPVLREQSGPPRPGVVVTASLAGLIAYPTDPVYALTKHAVVGLVRSLAESFEQAGVSICAVCPGLVDTALIAEAREQVSAEFPMMGPEAIASAVQHAWTADEPGALWVVQAGREPIAYNYRGVPGPRVESV